MDIVAIILSTAPIKAGLLIGALAFLYGTLKMELSFGLLGFFLCSVSGAIAQLFA